MDEIDNKILNGLADEKKQTEIAKDLGLSDGTISIRIKKMRESGIIIPEATLGRIDKLILQGLADKKSKTEIARELGLSDFTIFYRIKKMRERGIIIPEATLDRIDKLILQGLAEGKSQTEIATNLGLTQSSISRRIRIMRNQGIEIPELALDNIDKLILQGLADRKSQTEIAKALGKHRITIFYRINKMREMGIEIPVSDKRKTEDDETDKKIRKCLDENKTQTKIAEELGLSNQRVSQRKYKIIERDNKKLAKMIVNLIFTKHATIEQVKILGECYGVDVEEVLNSLDEHER